MEKNLIPTIQSSLRHHILKMPESCYSASGIIVNGRRIKTFVFTTVQGDDGKISGRMMI